jgi:hypothetical protein
MCNAVFLLSECSGCIPGVELIHVPDKNPKLNKKKKTTKTFLDLNQILKDI